MADCTITDANNTAFFREGALMKDIFEEKGLYELEMSPEQTDFYGFWISVDLMRRSVH